MSIDNEKIKAQVEAYSEVRPSYVLFASFLATVFRAAVKELGIENAIVSSRAKGIPNFVEKAIRRQERYPDPINQFDDLCGARIIVSFLDEIEPVCSFIRRYFVVNEAESEDVGSRLGVSEFGYRSVHFTVWLNKAKTDLLIEDLKISKEARPPEILFAQGTAEGCLESNAPASPRFRAEVQVRTLLAHAWAVCAHDLVYKSDFNVPDKLKRDTNRIAAALESVDNDLERALDGIRRYKTYFGPYLGSEEREGEIEKLKTVLRYDKDNEFVAYQVARLAVSLEEWAEAQSVLEPFVKKWEHSDRGKRLAGLVDVIDANESPHIVSDARTDLESLRDPHLSKILQEYGKAMVALAALKKEEGLKYMEMATFLDLRNRDAYVDLAKAHLEEGRSERALHYLEAAYRLAPNDPRILAEMVHARIVEERSAGFVSMLKPSLEGGIENCRERAEVGIYLPYAFYDMGFFALLLGRPYECLSAFCLAVVKSGLRKDVENALQRFDSIGKSLRNSSPNDLKDHIEMARRLLMLALVAKFGEEGADRRNYRKELESLKTRGFPALDSSCPIRVVAGGCDRRIEQEMQHYCRLLDVAFDGYTGVIFSGGTDSGVSGLVGNVSPAEGKEILKLSYLPNVPPWTKVHEAYRVFPTGHSGFSPFEPLQQWIDLISMKVDPARVSVLGINGGELTAFEFHLALALGAKVGVIRDSGRAAHEICTDKFWKDMPGLIVLPNDPQTIKLFVQPPSASRALLPEDRERMAKELHEDYQKKHKKDAVQLDPSVAEWDHLPEDLRDSNFQQIDHIEEKFQAIGFGIRKSRSGKITPLSIEPEKVAKFAEIEHGRWNMERLMKRWKAGEKKDVQNRISPYIVEWTKLPDEVKEWDYDGVKNCLALLEKYGYEIFKL